MSTFWQFLLVSLSLNTYIFSILQNARSVNALNKSRGRRRRESTRSVCASSKSRSVSSVLVSRKLRSVSAAVKRKERERQRKGPRYDIF